MKLKQIPIIYHKSNLPADYRETKNISSFILRLQTAGYMLWKSYHIEIDFTPDNLPYRYRIGAQHTIWE